MLFTKRNEKLIQLNTTIQPPCSNCTFPCLCYFMAQAVYKCYSFPYTCWYILTAHLLIDFWMVFELQTSIRQGCLSGSLIRVYKSRNLVGLEFHNLRSGWILAVLIHSPWRLPLKILGLKQTLTSLYSLRPDFGRNADWLLEQCHRIWLAVGINGSWKSLFLAWFFSRMISRGRREGSILLSFLFYGLIANEPSERRRSNGEAAAE